MLDFKHVLLLFALHLALSAKKDTKLEKKLYIPKNKSCERIKCPPIEQPVCAKLITKNGENRTIYVVMINKCEIKYAKCIKGFEANIVPMENCSHNGVFKTDKKRVKRQIQEDSAQSENGRINTSKREDALESSVIQKTVGDEGTEKEIKKANINHEQNTNEDIYERSKSAEIVVDDYNEVDGDNGKISDIEKGSDGDKGSEDEKGSNGEKGTDDENGSGNKKVSDNEKDNEEDGGEYQSEGENEINEKESDIPIGTSSEDDSSYNVTVDFEQYNAECPTVCPAQDVMVCARCQHGVYRTFLSPCHMRMFTCKQSHEVLELVYRLPCMMSAPYLSNKSMRPRGHLQVGEDAVLRFIRCRDMRQESREEDPRCQITDDEPNTKQLDLPDATEELSEY